METTNKSHLQQIIEDHIEDCACDEFSVREYSGRGMYGKTCLGVNINQASDVGELFSIILMAIEGEDDTVELQDTFASMKMDSLGRGTIIYFPGTPFSGEDTYEGEDDTAA